MAEITDAAVSRGSNLIRAFEGLRLRAYQDQRGIWTIGWGNIALADGSPVLSTSVITEAEALALHEATVAVLRRKLALMLRADPTDGQAAALLSFQYNEGSGALASSTLLHLLNADRAIAAAAQFREWVFVRIRGHLVRDHGLELRRERERACFLSGTAVPAVTAPQLEPAELATLRS